MINWDMGLLSTIGVVDNNNVSLVYKHNYCINAKLLIVSIIFKKIIIFGSFKLIIYNK